MKWRGDVFEREFLAFRTFQGLTFWLLLQLSSVALKNICKNHGGKEPPGKKEENHGFYHENSWVFLFFGWNLFEKMKAHGKRPSKRLSLSRLRADRC